MAQVRMPAIFFGHGNPMNAISDNGYTRGWRAIGENIRRPRAVLSISAHWYNQDIAVTAMEQPRTIHDFGGFPPDLYKVQYPAPGSPEVAERVRELLGDNVVADTDQWGLDHGTWSVLCHVFPRADVPVIQLSILETESARFHYQLAERLAPLRDEGVLIVGSGNIVPNLHAYARGDQSREPFDWAIRFEEWARSMMLVSDHEPLVDYELHGRDTMLSIPTPEHYLPLVYVLGVRHPDDEVTFPVEGFDGGSISMTTVRIG